jgi:hypothetical protein
MAQSAPPADAPQVVLEHTTLQGDKLRVIIQHAPGIDYFVVVERLESEVWTPVKRTLKEIFSPISSVMEVTVMQLVKQLSEAQAQIRRLQNPG